MEAKIELTNTAPPSKTIAKSFKEGHFIRISEKNHSGCSRGYAKVLREGLVSLNDVVYIK